MRRIPYKSLCVRKTEAVDTMQSTRRLWIYWIANDFVCFFRFIYHTGVKSSCVTSSMSESPESQAVETFFFGPKQYIQHAQGWFMVWSQTNVLSVERKGLHCWSCNIFIFWFAATYRPWIAGPDSQVELLLVGEAKGFSWAASFFLSSWISLLSIYLLISF